MTEWRRLWPCGVLLLLVACTRPPEAKTSALDDLGDRTRCAAFSGRPVGWGSDPRAGMVRLEGGEFSFGSDRGYTDERPVVTRSVEPFWIDRTEVTNAQFADFIKATGHVTTAERGDGVVVFETPEADRQLEPGSWWRLAAGASWRHPRGEGGDEVRGNEPVVGVSHADALAYAKWLGRALPDERQWEFAAKSGRDNTRSDSGLRDAQGRPAANFWQGFFPLEDQAEDGYRGRAPVGCFAANPFGLHDMVGNVWEWTIDTYRENRQDAGHLPPEPGRLASRSGGVVQRVIKGGSYLCSADYCVRARASSRQPQEENLPALHLGFRTISQ